ncbi:MAG: ferritin family protein [Candidatus Tantalella remota]|nr:ferritin family protein [Candidatus Tantalella remota]
MGNKREELLNEAIKAESNMAQLYRVYQEIFTEDAEFWGQLVEEEKQHASIIDIGRNVLTEDDLSKTFLYNNLEELKAANKLVTDMSVMYKEDPPSREDAYHRAIELEERFFESFYQDAITGEPGSEEKKIIQKLNSDSKDHAARIRALLG